MKINQVLVESAGATVAFAFGRFNPAHQGHIAVWRAVEQAGANWFIGTNPSTLGPNDPLTFQQKSAWMEEIYPPIQGHIVPEQSVLTLAAYIFKKLRNNERATVAYITDATDWAWSGKLLNQYNGVEGTHGYYKFAQIIHEPSPRVSSATALRDAARADDRVAFYHASGTDPKAKVAGLTYFDTVKQACEKYPLPVKKAKKVKEEQGVAEGSETEADIDKKIAFHQQGQAAAQYKGSMNKMHAAKIRELQDKKEALKKQGVDENKVPMSQFRPTLKQAGIETPRAPLWSFQEIAQKLGISYPALNSLAFNIIGNFPEAVPGVKSHVGSTKYYNSNEIKRWVNANNVRERIKASQSKVSEDEQKTQAKTWDQMTPKEKISGVKGRTVWNEKTQRYYTVFDVPAKQVKEENIPYWTNLPESMSIDEKIAFFEQYHTKGNLLESNDIDTVEYFKTLVNDASTPIKNKSYIVVPLMLANNQLNLLDKKPQYLEFIGQGSKGLVFNSDDGEISYPPKRFNGISITHTFTFETEKDYDEFRTMIGLRFDLQLPKVNVIHNEASLATMRDYFAGDENARDPYEITKF
jgi:hypothetical protein